MRISAHIKHTVKEENNIENQPLYPSGKAYYIWYKNSIAEEVTKSTVYEEYDLLYQSVRSPEYRAGLNLYVKVYAACLAMIIIISIAWPIFTYALNTSRENNPVTLYQTDSDNYVNKSIIITDQSILNSDSITVNSMGLTDLKNNVLYILQANGNYSIQESSWNSEEKAINRLNELDLKGLKGANGNNLKVTIEKVFIFPGGNWYRVKIGEFTELHEAKIITAKLRAGDISENIPKLNSSPLE